ncbi:MAG: hypothetical protein M3O36_10825 [Myxococcota bacterium]|nr:hypothetical protein [Myxococcota bacterium]
MTQPSISRSPSPSIVSSPSLATNALRSSWRRARAASALAHGFAGIVAAMSLGCADHAKQSAARAAENVADLAVLVDKDVSEVERGMPQGAKRLAPLVALGADPRQDVAGVRRALLRVRREVLDLSVAKSTFFAIADVTGMAIRNDLEEDVMAGQNLFAVFPALAAAKDRYVTTTGTFPNATSKSGPDEDWVAGVPVEREDGSTGAVFVTGWTYRYFARHLQESLNDRLTEQAKEGRNDGKLPVFYVSVFDKSGVYSAPLTPPIDEKALAEQDLVGRTQATPVFQGTTTIADRAFGYAAQRTPKLGPDTGVVVLRSDM